MAFPVPETRTLEYQRRKRALVDLPRNGDSFSFIGILRDGSERACTISKNGVIYATGGGDAPRDLVAWRNT